MSFLRKHAEPVAPTTLVTRGIIGGALSVALNLLVYAGAKLLGVPMKIQSDNPTKPPRPVPVPAIIIASLLPGPVGGLIYAAVRMLSDSPVSMFQAISVGTTAVSFFSPLGLPADGKTRTVMNIMHVVAAWTITSTLTGGDED